MNYQQTWGPVTQTGPLGTPHNHRFASVPSSYTIDWFANGTAPVAGTFVVKGSSDGVHYYALTDVTDFTGPGMMHIANKPVMYLRIDILTYTQGDPTTSAFFNYTGGQ